MEGERGVEGIGEKKLPPDHTLYPNRPSSFQPFSQTTSQPVNQLACDSQ
jgi:hypothetical protein